MAAYKRIRALSRAIVVLEHLNGVGESSSNAIATAVGLPKTTSYRMLKSLMECDLAYYSPSKNGFRLTPRMEELSPRTVAQPCVSTVIDPALIDLSLHILWPCAFSVFEDGTMVTKARTHQTSPFTISSDLHIRRDIWTSGAGLAFLAFVNTDERIRLLDSIDPSQKARFEEKLSLIQARGYALEKEAADDKLATLAVPLCDPTGAIGSLHATWLPSAHDTDDMILDRMLPRLLATRQHIESAFA